MAQAHSQDYDSRNHNQTDDESIDDINLSSQEPTFSPLNTSSRLLQASYRDNEFSSKDLGRTPSNQSQQPYQGEHTPMSPLSPSESVHTDFTGMLTVQDYGIGSGWQMHLKSQAEGDDPTQSSPPHDRERAEVSIPQNQPETRERNPDMYVTGDSEHSIIPQRSSHSNSDGYNEQSDSQTYVQYLRVELDDKQEVNSGDPGNLPFLPINKLLRLLREPNVKRVLDEAAIPGGEASLDQLASDICHETPENSRRMILATLLCVNKVESITCFIKDKIYDIDLPLRRHRHRNQVVFHRKDDTEDDPALESPTGWDFNSLDQFCTAQYNFLIPFFDMSPGSAHFYKIENTHIRLPFVEWYEQTSGGYGTVRRTRIHRAHHNYVSYTYLEATTGPDLTPNLGITRSKPRFRHQRNIPGEL